MLEEFEADGDDRWVRMMKLLIRIDGEDIKLGRGSSSSVSDVDLLRPY